MRYEHISNDAKFREFCARIASADRIAFDTEFVSEDTYRPELCLVQVAAGDELAVIDPMTIDDLEPFWRLIVEGDHETIVHAGREEMRFAMEATGSLPKNLLDVQLAAGLVGLEYPAAYGTLISKLLGQTLPKGETRTNWRRRPLSDSQLEYALQDVIHLNPIRNSLLSRLEELDRLEWLAEEISNWSERLVESEAEERWRRVSGVTNLRPKSQAIVRELWRWREEEARRRNRPVKRILRDDLIVELAKRQTADLKKIKALRGMERRDISREIPNLASHIEKALALPQDEWPKSQRSSRSPQINLLSQFLSTALSSICRSADVAPSLVGSNSDMRELIAYILKTDRSNSVPSLAKGWRATVVGKKIEELLAGNLSIRITDPLGDHPLEFEASE